MNLYKYSVTPWSGKNFRRNSLDCGPKQEPCAICGTPLDTDYAHIWAVVVDGGATWGDEESDADDSGFMGYYPVGPDCHKRFKVRT